MTELTIIEWVEIFIPSFVIFGIFCLYVHLLPNKKCSCPCHNLHCKLYSEVCIGCTQCENLHTYNFRNKNFNQ